MATLKSLRTIKFALAIFAVVSAVFIILSVTAFKPSKPEATKSASNYYRFTLDNPSFANQLGYVSDVGNWSSNLVPVDITSLSCLSGSYQPCEIITDINDVDATTHKMKGAIAEEPGSSTYNIVSSYTPSTGSAAFSNRTP